MTDKESLLLAFINSAKNIAKIYESTDSSASHIEVYGLLSDSLSKTIQIGGEITTLLDLMKKSLSVIGIQERREGFDVEINNSTNKAAFRLVYDINKENLLCPLYITADWMFVLLYQYINSNEFRNNFLL